MGAGLELALAGGGTGGHVVPGLRVLEAFAPGELGGVLWFVTGRAAEDAAFAGLARALGDVPCERVVLDLEPPGRGAPGPGRLLARVLPETLAARRALARHRSAVLLGLGGFTSLPAVLAARSLGVPVALLEVNAVPGRATRLLAPLARRVLHAWRASLPAGAARSTGRAGRHVFTGPPLGPLARVPVSRGSRGLAPGRRPLLLVLGGSQGAAGLNRFVREQAATLAGGGLDVLHQVGPGRLAEGAQPQAGYRAVEFLADVPAALEEACLVLCRGGASTLAEVAAAAVPAVVVPYPHAPDRHQERNARELGEGVLVVPEEQLDRALAERLVALAGPAGESERGRRAACLAACVPRDGSARARDVLLELARPAGIRGGALFRAPRSFE